MSSILPVALSGLFASQRRLETAASNIVNAHSAGDAAGRPAYTPQRAVTEPAPGGGVAVRTVPLSPGHVSLFAPDHPGADASGLVSFPNVSLAAELVEIKMAVHSYKASAKLIERADEMAQALLDTTDRR